jgi:hypothetical protein
MLNDFKERGLIKAPETIDAELIEEDVLENETDVAEERTDGE